MSSQAQQCVIQHGIVDSVTQDSVFVKMVSMSMCASCQLRGVCNMSDMHEKLIEARRPEDKELKAGDKVLLEMESSLGPRAVLLGYFYPFLLVLASLIITTSIGMDQGISAIISVGLLIPYYTLLYLFRNKMKKRFVFKIR